MNKALIDRIKIGCFGLDPIDPLRVLLDEVIETLAQPEQQKPYRLLQDNGSKYFGESWDKAEQPAQPDQEPVREEKYIYGTPLLDAMTQDYVPPQRIWVDLNHQQFIEATDGLEDLEDCWMAIQAKLKEVNA